MTPAASGLCSDLLCQPFSVHLTWCLHVTACVCTFPCQQNRHCLEGQAHGLYFLSITGPGILLLGITSTQKSNSYFRLYRDSFLYAALPGQLFKNNLLCNAAKKCRWAGAAGNCCYIALFSFQDILVELCLALFPETGLLNSTPWHVRCCPRTFAVSWKNSPLIPPCPHSLDYQQWVQGAGLGQHGDMWIPPAYLRIWQRAQAACMGFKRKLLVRASGGMPGKNRSLLP